MINIKVNFKEFSKTYGGITTLKELELILKEIKQEAFREGLK